MVVTASGSVPVFWIFYGKFTLGGWFVCVLGNERLKAEHEMRLLFRPKINGKTFGKSKEFAPETPFRSIFIAL